MDLKNITFVALDLETTGLSPEKDTIIEVAALKFHLERDGDVFRMIDIEERSMLIDPGRDIDEHISMITGISNEMVRGKSKWKEVKDRVETFIGTDSIIVGHNVLFDIAMFETHGIAIGDHITLDTFELSELYSPEAESLNLGFLGKHLGIDMESEHRALDDTRLSARLFIHYLSRVSTMPEDERKIWRYARSRDKSRSIDTLLTITLDEEGESDLDEDLFQCEGPVTKEGNIIHKKSGTPYEVVSLSGEWEEERSLFEAAVKRGKVLIFVSSKKQSTWLEMMLSSYRVVEHIDSSEYISLEMLRFLIRKQEWSRKETVLLLRLMKWIARTEAGRIDEIKWYGDEVRYKEVLRARTGEYSRFHRENEELKKDADIIIAVSYGQDTAHEISRDHATLIVRDIMDLESSIRFRDSHRIAWSDLYRYLRELDSLEDESRDKISTALSLIEEILRGVIERPTGPSISPPGEYGETYYFTQKDLWHRGYIWLIWAAGELEDALSSIEDDTSFDPLERRYFEFLKGSIKTLQELIHIGNTNLGLILQIKDDTTSLSIIPREMKDEISTFLSTHAGGKNIITGYNIGTLYQREYLADACGIVSMDTLKTSAKKIEIRGSRVNHITPGKTVFLGTNLKHLRSLREELGKFTDYPIYTQGVSGGRGKMRTLFEKESDALLLGLIDTWKDDSHFWMGVDTLYITKVPFDPPSDPYYLSRTAGMSNNFENYSLPMAIHTLSTLIGRVTSANPDAEIAITDEKLMTMSWGHTVRDALKIYL